MSITNNIIFCYSKTCRVNKVQNKNKGQSFRAKRVFFYYFLNFIVRTCIEFSKITTIFNIWCFWRDVLWKNGSKGPDNFTLCNIMFFSWRWKNTKSYHKILGIITDALNRFSVYILNSFVTSKVSVYMNLYIPQMSCSCVRTSFEFNELTFSYIDGWVEQL